MISGVRQSPGVLVGFEQFLAEKQRQARAARIGTFQTEEDNSSRHAFLSVGNEWTRRHYDGNFLMSPPSALLPSVSLGFVRSREGNTVAPRLADLGGGDTDFHFLHEGLSRVAADGVLAGARTATGRTFFSVWHPDIVALRQTLGFPRHPAQIVVSDDGSLDPDALLFNVPSARVFVVAGPVCRQRWARLFDRPGLTVIPMEHGDLTQPLLELRRYGLHRISVVGGRTTASALIDAGLVQDIYVTTTLRSAGRPGTPFYAGAEHITLDPIVRKRLRAGDGAPVVQFEHLKVRPADGPPPAGVAGIRP